MFIRFLQNKQAKKNQFDTDETKVFNLIKQKYDRLVSFIANIDTMATQSISFDVFLKRYHSAKKLRVNLRCFLIEELNYVDELLRVVQKKIASSNKTNAYQKITEELVAKYSHYPKSDLGKNFPDEYGYLLGAIREFSNAFTDGIEKIGRFTCDKELKSLYHKLEYSYQLLFIDDRKGYPKIFQTTLIKTYRMKKLDDIQKEWHEVYKLMFTVLMELTRFINGVYKKDQIKENMLFAMEKENILFSEWREKILHQIDRLMSDFRLKGLI